MDTGVRDNHQNLNKQPRSVACHCGRGGQPARFGFSVELLEAFSSLFSPEVRNTEKTVGRTKDSLACTFLYSSTSSTVTAPIIAAPTAVQTDQNRANRMFKVSQHDCHVTDFVLYHAPQLGHELVLYHAFLYDFILHHASARRNLHVSGKDVKRGQASASPQSVLY